LLKSKRQNFLDMFQVIFLRIISGENGKCHQE
jgi:hypothetical protein